MPPSERAEALAQRIAAYLRQREHPNGQPPAHATTTDATPTWHRCQHIYDDGHRCHEMTEPGERHCRRLRHRDA
jgi:hypothetical protein